MNNNNTIMGRLIDYLACGAVKRIVPSFESKNHDISARGHLARYIKDSRQANARFAKCKLAFDMLYVTTLTWRASQHRYGERYHTQWLFDVGLFCGVYGEGRVGVPVACAA